MAEPLTNQPTSRTISKSAIFDGPGWGKSQKNSVFPNCPTVPALDPAIELPREEGRQCSPAPGPLGRAAEVNYVPSLAAYTDCPRQHPAFLCRSHNPCAGPILKLCTLPVVSMSYSYRGNIILIPPFLLTASYTFSHSPKSPGLPRIDPINRLQPLRWRERDLLDQVTCLARACAQTHRHTERPKKMKPPFLTNLSVCSPL